MSPLHHHPSLLCKYANVPVCSLSTVAVLVMDILAWRKSKTVHKLKGGEGLLGNPVGTEYKPVWSDTSRNPHPNASLEPMRDERE